MTSMLSQPGKALIEYLTLLEVYRTMFYSPFKELLAISATFYVGLALRNGSKSNATSPFHSDVTVRGDHVPEPRIIRVQYVDEEYGVLYPVFFREATY